MVLTLCVAEPTNTTNTTMNKYQKRITYPNGYTASIVCHSFSYGGHEGLFEVAVLVGESLHYDNPVARGDVLGNLDFAEVAEVLARIAALPPVNP
jgi:hypothetical protein